MNHQPTLPALAGLLIASLLVAAQAAPYTPASDQQIVQTLPNRLDAGARAQRKELARQPQQLSLALATARAAIDRARRHGDPRELGLAQAALAPWWSLEMAPPAVRLLRAIVRQSQHDFDAALRDLDPLAKDDPALPLALQAQAGLTRAAVLQVSGRLAEADAACGALTAARFAALGSALAVPAHACLAELRSLRGQMQPAAQALRQLAARAPNDHWLALLRAELAQRMGDTKAAATHFQQAINSGDIYTRSAYADWLLDQGRAADALKLVEAAEPGDGAADALLLRRAIALKRLASPLAAPASAALTARFEAAQLRGENFHQREQARLALDVTGQPELALQLALLNWEHQKEPADALLLQRAATASGKPAAAEPLRRWVAATGYADVRLDASTP